MLGAVMEAGVGKRQLELVTQVVTRPRLLLLEVERLQHYCAGKKRQPPLVANRVSCPLVSALVNDALKVSPRVSGDAKTAGASGTPPPRYFVHKPPNEQTKQKNRPEARTDARDRTREQVACWLRGLRLAERVTPVCTGPCSARLESSHVDVAYLIIHPTP